MARSDRRREAERAAPDAHPRDQLRRALGLPDAYYTALADGYRARRDTLIAPLVDIGLRPFIPDGAYYVMCDFSALSADDDVTFARRLTADPGVATVPGSSFYSRPELGATKIRFAFPKRAETLAEAARRLELVHA